MQVKKGFGPPCNFEVMVIIIYYYIVKHLLNLFFVLHSKCGSYELVKGLVVTALFERIIFNLVLV